MPDQKPAIPSFLILGPGRVGYFSLALFFFIIAFFLLPERTHHRNLYYIFIFIPVLGALFYSSPPKLLIGRRLLWSLVLLFLFFTALSAAWMDAPGWEDLFDVTRYLLLVISFFFLVRYAVEGWSRDQINSFFWVLVVAVAAVAILTMVVHYASNPFPGSRVPALTRHGKVQTLAANMFGFFAVIGLVYLLDGDLRTRMSRRAMLVLLGAVFSLVLFLLLAQTRGALLAFVFAAGVFLVCKRRWVLLACAIAGAILVLMGVEYYASMRGFLDRGLGARPEIWADAIRQISDRPFFGHGRMEEFVLEGGSNQFGHPHNVIIFILLQTGLVGLAVWSVLTGYALRRMYVIGRNAGQWWLFSGLVFSLVAMLFTSRDFLISPGVTWLLYWLPVAVLLVIDREGNEGLGPVKDGDGAARD